jgi:hypothetical protein
MKAWLYAQFNEYKGKYSELISSMEKSHKTTIWGKGIMPAYSPAPYMSELQGCKPGRFLKKDYEPAKNRQCYFLNKDGRTMGELKFAKYTAMQKQWIVYRRFFLHEADQILELTFGSELNGNLEANLDSVSLIMLQNDKATRHYSLSSTGEYFETLYQYNADKITSITEKIWRSTCSERYYEINHADDSLIIFELLINNNRLKIYPVE